MEKILKYYIPDDLLAGIASSLTLASKQCRDARVVWQQATGARA
jgi:hypothetical protein